MRFIMIPAALLTALTLNACTEPRLTPAPGEAPDWPQVSPPRPSDRPLPFTRNYAPHSGPVVQGPELESDERAPFAVRGQYQIEPPPEPEPVYQQ